MEENNNSAFSKNIEVYITSTPTFNVVANMEGPNRSFLNYIEKQTNCKLFISDPIYEINTENGLVVTIASDTNESIEKAESLLNDLIQTVEAQKQKQTKLKAAKKAKKSKSETRPADLPQSLLTAMKFYFPGPPNEPPPPGTTADHKLHKKYFKQVGQEQHWF